MTCRGHRCLKSGACLAGMQAKSISVHCSSAGNGMLRLAHMAPILTKSLHLLWQLLTVNGGVISQSVCGGGPLIMLGGSWDVQPDTPQCMLLPHVIILIMLKSFQKRICDSDGSTPLPVSTVQHREVASAVGEARSVQEEAWSRWLGNKRLLLAQ